MAGLNEMVGSIQVKLPLFAMESSERLSRPRSDTVTVHTFLSGVPRTSYLVLRTPYSMNDSRGECRLQRLAKASWGQRDRLLPWLCSRA